MKLLTWTLAATLILAACSSDSRTPMTSAPSAPSPPASETESWMFAVRFILVTGPDNCLVRERSIELAGTAFSDVPTSIVRSTSSLTINNSLFAEFFGAPSFVGTFTGAEFTATAAPLGSGRTWTCQDGTVLRQQPGTARVTGSFSTDGRQLTATDIHGYPLESGGQVDYTWAWAGTRRN